MPEGGIGRRKKNKREKMKGMTHSKEHDPRFREGKRKKKSCLPKSEKNVKRPYLKKHNEKRLGRRDDWTNLTA